MGLGFPICQTQHKDSCLLPNASVYLPNLAPSCLLPRQSVITTSARKAQEAAGHTAQPVSHCSPAKPGPRPHTGKYVEMDMQVLRHGSAHTCRDEHACTDTLSRLDTLMCDPPTKPHCVHTAAHELHNHTSTLCTHCSTQAAYPHTHTACTVQHTGCIPTHAQVGMMLTADKYAEIFLPLL